MRGNILQQKTQTLQPSWSTLSCPVLYKHLKLHNYSCSGVDGHVVRYVAKHIAIFIKQSTMNLYWQRSRVQTNDKQILKTFYIYTILCNMEKSMLLQI